MARKLKKDTQLFIIEALACYKHPADIIKEVKECFDEEVNYQSVAHYDPTKVAGADLAKEYKDLFNQIRQAYLADLGSEPLASTRFRLGKLRRLIENAESAKLPNVPLIAELLKQAAQESGGMFTNKTEIAITPPKPLEQMTNDELADFRSRVAILKGRR